MPVDTAGWPLYSPSAVITTRVSSMPCLDASLNRSLDTQPATASCSNSPPLNPRPPPPPPAGGGHQRMRARRAQSRDGAVDIPDVNFETHGLPPVPPSCRTSSPASRIAGARTRTQPVTDPGGQPSSTRIAVPDAHETPSIAPSGNAGHSSGQRQGHLRPRGCPVMATVAGPMAGTARPADEDCRHGHPTAAARALARASSRGCGACRAVECALRRDGRPAGTPLGYRFWKPSTAATAWTGRSWACRAARSTWRSSVWRRRRTRRLGLISLSSTCRTLPPKSASWPGWPPAGAHPVAQIDYWQANGGVTYQDPDGREVVFASWIYGPPGS